MHSVLHRIILFTVCASWLGAQTGFRSDSRLVLVNAGVFDDRQRFQTGLRPDNFELFDDGAAVTLQSVSIEDVPLSTVILLDASRSMGRSLELAKAALGRYLERSRYGDEYCLMVFNDRVPPACQFRRDTAWAKVRISDLSPGRGTALYDAILAGLAMTRHAHNRRRALLILSDGLENSSAHVWNELRRAVEETTAVLYAVTLPPWRGRDEWHALRLRQLIEETGGYVVTVDHPREMGAALERIEVRLQYVLTFVPPPGAESKPRHSLRLRLRGEPAKGLRVYWRHFYSVPAL